MKEFAIAYHLKLHIQFDGLQINKAIEVAFHTDEGNQIKLFSPSHFILVYLIVKSISNSNPVFLGSRGFSYSSSQAIRYNRWKIYLISIETQLWASKQQNINLEHFFFSGFAIIFIRVSTQLCIIDSNNHAESDEWIVVKWEGEFQKFSVFNGFWVFERIGAFVIKN